MSALRFLPLHPKDAEIFDRISENFDLLRGKLGHLRDFLFGGHGRIF